MSAGAAVRRGTACEEFMSNDEKDRYGQKLQDVEAARENEWAHKRDQELIEKMRARKTVEPTCPECEKKLVRDDEHGTGGMVCPERHGAWLSWDAIVKMLDRLAHPGSR